MKLGPSEFVVQIDTESDVLWVNCDPCARCQRYNDLRVQHNFYHIAASPTVQLVPCSHPVCQYAIQNTTTGCECFSEMNQCLYTIMYGDGSGASGYYVFDVMSYDMIVAQPMLANTSSTIVFGCSTERYEDMTPSRNVDGIFGFGPGSLSVISQLSSQGITPKLFSHCLKGDGNGGGILVLGEIVEPNVVYSPLVPSWPHYGVHLESVAVNGQLLSIDPVVFATSIDQGTMVDCGTTLTYFVEEAYDSIINAITVNVSQFANSTISSGSQCYMVPPNSSRDIFPTISLNFMGGASMILKPDFLHAVLKDKIIVYDLENERIRWADYDCSSYVNVSLPTSKSKDEPISAGQLSVGCSHIVFIAALFMYITIFMESSFL